MTEDQLREIEVRLGASVSGGELDPPIALTASDIRALIVEVRRLRDMMSVQITSEEPPQG